jgi:SAM-dependent methyltransferase
MHGECPCILFSRLTRNPGKDWAARVYETNASIYQSILEAGLKTAPAEVKGMAKLFKRNGVADGSYILDVACGIGRHSVFLARAGYQVTGLDPSSNFLARAKELATEKGVSQRARFVLGWFSNMLEVLDKRGIGKFRGITVMDASIGVTGRDEDDLQLFNDLSIVAAKGAILVVEIFDRDWFVEYAKPTLTEEFPDDLVRTWRWLSVPGSPVLEAEWAFFRRRPDKGLKHLFTTRVSTRHYSVAELRSLVRRAGWKYLACYGSLEDLHRFTSSDFRAFLVFRR